VYADHLADPGNLGTLIRAAAAFAAAALVTSPESADVWSPKVVRASMLMPNWLRSLPTSANRTCTGWSRTVAGPCTRRACGGRLSSASVPSGLACR
jgi:tRNA G18 (ribose-2'-O)-methylase SpoU